jgi:type III secretion protein R
MTPNSLPNPVVMVIILGALTLAPFVLVMLTSFVKMSVVLSILRNALGTQNVPPNQVITGLAFVLTLFVMTPVVKQMYHAAGSVSNTKDMFSEASVRSVVDAVGRGREPLRQFLIRHAHNDDRVLFVDLANRLDVASDPHHPQGSNPTSAQSSMTSPTTGTVQTVAATKSGTDTAIRADATAPNATTDAAQNQATSPDKGNASAVSKAVTTTQSGADAASTVGAAAPNATADATQSQATSPDKGSTSALSKDDFQVIIPAFVTSQLKEAFEIGFLIFIPFVIIDMVIANILLAMGMTMLSPSVISLPFKLLLFVLVDGWFLLVRGLVLSYV